MAKKKRVGRPIVKDKKIPFTITATKSKIRSAIKRAGDRKKLNKIIQNALYELAE